jgi:hypothetical protein
MKTNPIPKSIGEYLELDSSSPSGLTWKKYAGGKSKAGKNAGCLENGRYGLRFKKTHYLCYRIVYFLQTGEDLGNRLADHGNNPISSNNIRPATFSQNNICKPKMKRNKSGYKGVSWCKQTKKWRAQIAKNSKDLHLGRFKTKEEAARAYNDAALEHFGEFAYLNPV